MIFLNPETVLLNNNSDQLSNERISRVRIGLYHHPNTKWPKKVKFGVQSNLTQHFKNISPKKTFLNKTKRFTNVMRQNNGILIWS